MESTTYSAGRVHHVYGSLHLQSNYDCKKQKFVLIMFLLTESIRAGLQAGEGSCGCLKRFLTTTPDASWGGGKFFYLNRP